MAGCTAVGVSIRPTEALTWLTGMQPRHRSHRCGQWLPPGDAPGTGARLCVVGDAREPAAQLDGGRQLSLLIEHGADRGSIGFVDDEHPVSMATRARASKPTCAADARLSKPRANCGSMLIPTHLTRSPDLTACWTAAPASASRPEGPAPAMGSPWSGRLASKMGCVMVRYRPDRSGRSGFVAVRAAGVSRGESVQENFSPSRQR
jgi:hypothetical protein